MSKKTKERLRLLHAKTLSSEEGCRLLILSGWRRIRKTVGRKKTGTSHQYFLNDELKLETCVPGGKHELSDTVCEVLQKLAALSGD